MRVRSPGPDSLACLSTADPDGAAHSQWAAVDRVSWLHLPRLRHPRARAAELVTRMYADRADCETRTTELKEDLSLDTFYLQSFDATNAAFRTGCVRYHPLMGFRETVLPSCWFERRLRTVRGWVSLVGADLIPDARRLRVRFAVPPEERLEFLQRLHTLAEGLQITAQVEWELTNANEPNQTPVHIVNVPVPTGRSLPHTPSGLPLSTRLLRKQG